MPEETPSRVILAIKQAWDAGCPVAQSAEVIAPVATRRWRSSRRRGIAADDYQARIRDLVKGLIEGLEPDPLLVGPLRADYEYLALRIAANLLDQDV
jgi:hypothetical protein